MSRFRVFSNEKRGFLIGNTQKHKEAARLLYESPSGNQVAGLPLEAHIVDALSDGINVISNFKGSIEIPSSFGTGRENHEKLMTIKSIEEASGCI